MKRKDGFVRVEESIRPQGYVLRGYVKTTAMKKPYQPPKLTVYGDLTEMTKAKEGGMSQADGGFLQAMRKT